MLQKAAAEGGTVRTLAQLLASDAASSSVQVREGCLRALGAMCLNHDDSRKQLIEAKVRVCWWVGVCGGGGWRRAGGGASGAGHSRQVVVLWSAWMGRAV